MSIRGYFRKRFSKSLYKSAYRRSFYTLYGLVFKEVSNCFRQFYTWHYPFSSLFRTLSICLSSLTRIFLGRSVKFSFAYTGEDRIVESMLKPLIQYNGYYVDVGCNHPIFLSNTYLFYRRGWRGLCIDVNPKLIRKFASLRPKDIAIEALVSDNTEEMDFYLVQNDVLSTVEKENLIVAKNENLEYEVIKVVPKTLTGLLDKYDVPERIDLLTIDAEEHDFNVLNSLDFKKYKPKLIIIEDEKFDLLDPNKNRIYILLISKGYELIGFILKNIYFKEKVS